MELCPHFDKWMQLLTYMYWRAWLHCSFYLAFSYTKKFKLLKGISLKMKFTTKNEIYNSNLKFTTYTMLKRENEYYS